MRTLIGACAGLLLFAGAALFPATASAAEVTSTIRVSGWVCGGCTGRTERTLSALDGVKDVNADLEARQVTVVYDDEVVTLGTIEAAITKMKYTVEK